MESHHDGPSEREEKRRWQHYYCSSRMLISLPGLTTTNKKKIQQHRRLDLVFFLFMFSFFFVGLTTAVPAGTEDVEQQQHLERADLGISDDVTSIKPPTPTTLKEDLLGEISEITTGNLGSLCISHQHRSVPVPLRANAFEPARQKADLLARLLQDLGQIDNQGLLKLLIRNLVKSERSIETARIVTFNRILLSGKSRAGLSSNDNEQNSKEAIIPSEDCPTTNTNKEEDALTTVGLGISPVFMAHAVRPSSPYAEPVLQVIHDNQQQHQKDSINNITQQSTSTAEKKAALIPANNNNNNKKELTNERLMEEPWFDDPFGITSDICRRMKKFMPNSASNLTFLGWWTYPYFVCSSRTWRMTYSIPVVNGNGALLLPNNVDRLDGLLSIDVSVSSMDIDQCGVNPSSTSSAENPKEHHLAQQHQAAAMVITHFSGTHKCHRESSRCRFEAGHGWIRGGYLCTCLPGYYSPYIRNATFNGSHVELAYRNKMTFSSDVYDQLYRCLPCSPGCEQCSDDSPCLAPYDWPFRIVLLVISMICVVTCICLMGAVAHFRRLKVFKVASPVFLCVTLFGSAVMYAEMAAIFPTLNTPACVATKWTRHMGFCITYSSLLMKTWRVSLTYRVKSAHKLKLTDQQLLHWMLPILLVATVYLGAWTASDPPTGEYILTGPTMKFTQCTYNWWDHSAAIGEMFFLMWGIHVCYSVRHAETYFNETKHISWAIYNITVVNIVMASIHLLFLPNVGPDMKYLFGFIRTQLSTTVTIALVFGPKFYLVATGAGDEHDPRARARGVTATFSLNGISVPAGVPMSGQHPEEPDEPVDLYRENEELKEQLQKLAGHLEFMKIVHMGVNNPHLKPKSSSYFSQAHPSPQGTAPAIPEAGSKLPLRRATLEPTSLSAAAVAASVHFEGTLDSDVLLRRKNSSTSGVPNQSARGPLSAPSLSVSVDDVLLDDSPTAELLPFSSGRDGGGGDNRP